MSLMTRSRRKRQVDISVNPYACMDNVLLGKESFRSDLFGDDVRRPRQKRRKRALRSLGSVLLFPFAVAKKCILSLMRACRMRWDDDAPGKFAKELPYVRPQLNLRAQPSAFMANLATPGGGSIAMEMEDVLARPGVQERAERRAREAERERQRRAERRTRRQERAHQAIGALRERWRLRSRRRAEQAERRARANGAQQRTAQAQKVRTAAAQAKWATLTRGRALALLAGGLMGLCGFFGWYMAEGRYCVITVNDDGAVQQVRTKEGSVQDALAVAGVALTPEDIVSVDLSQRPEEGLQVTIARAREIDITEGDQTTHVRLANGTVQGALELAGIAVDKDDLVTPALHTDITEDTAITIVRAKNMTVKTKDASVSVRLAEGTVQDALNKAGITYDPKDEISPSLDTPISEGLQIVLTTVDVKTETKTYSVAYKTIEQKSSSLAKGKTKVSREGKEGVRTVVEQVTYKDGQEAGRKVISDEITTAPVNKVVLVGTKVSTNSDVENLPAGGPSADMIARTVVVDQITAYTHTGNRTATGKWPKVGMCAVNPKVFPYGTRFYIPGYGYAVAEDTGANDSSAVSIDVFMDTEAACLRWGRKRNVKVYVLK